MCFVRAEADGREWEHWGQGILVLEVLLEGSVGEVGEEEDLERHLVIFEDLLTVEGLEREGRLVDFGDVGAFGREVRRVEVRLVVVGV